MGRPLKTPDYFEGKDLFYLTGQDLEDFHHMMEALYEERRARIGEFCQDLMEMEETDLGEELLDQLSNVNPRYTQYNPEDGVGYCGIPKVREKEEK